MRKAVHALTALLMFSPAAASAQGYEGLIAPDTGSSASPSSREAPVSSPYISPSPQAQGNAITAQEMQKVLDSLPQKLAMEELNKGDDSEKKAEMDFRALIEATKAEQGSAYKGPSVEEAQKMDARRASLAKQRLEGDVKMRKFQETLAQQRERYLSQRQKK